MGHGGDAMSSARPRVNEVGRGVRRPRAAVVLRRMRRSATTRPQRTNFATPFGCHIVQISDHYRPALTARGGHGLDGCADGVVGETREWTRVHERRTSRRPSQRAASPRRKAASLAGYSTWITPSPSGSRAGIPCLSSLPPRPSLLYSWRSTCSPHTRARQLTTMTSAETARAGARRARFTARVSGPVLSGREYWPRRR